MDSGMDVLTTAYNLYHSTLEGDWNGALATYRNNASIRETAINSSGDTALHVAVNDDRVDMVAELVDEIMKKGSFSALETKNDVGDTPLHRAASRGSRQMCECIAKAQGDNKLIESRNKNGETPLFLAALHGHKDVFLYLHFRDPDHNNGLWKRNSDGETVLHCTISRDHLDLAFQIIHLYGDHIVGSVDEWGVTPLHMLANKPSAFISSCKFRWYNKLVYSCIFVDPLRSLEQLPRKNVTLHISRMKLSHKTHTGGDAEDPSDDGYENVPPNYWTCYDIFVRAFTFVVQPVVETLGLQYLKDLKKKKQKHVWCRQILDQLWVYSNVAYVGGGSAFQGYSLLRQRHIPKPGDMNQTVKPKDDENQNQHKEEIMNEDKLEGNSLSLILSELRELRKSLCEGKTSGWASKGSTGWGICRGNEKKKGEWDRKESALFIAAKNGVLEILEKILRFKPGAIYEINSHGQNVLHVAVAYRQPHVLKLIMKQKQSDNLVQAQDNKGNTVLHLAARLSQHKPWHTPGSALQMQWEIQWFMYIKEITPNYVPFLPNNDQETPAEIFRKDHENLVKDGTHWLERTSQSCSVVAALIAGVAFATSSTIPGGTQEETGKPYLERHPAFNMFALTSLLALCCSITSLIMFLSILTSRQQPRDFRKDLPLKLLLGLSSLFVSITSILASFSAAFFFVLKDSLKQVLFPLYVATILPITFYAIVQFPLYADLVIAIFSKVPQSSNRETDNLIL